MTLQKKDQPRDARDFAISAIWEVLWKRRALDDLLERWSAEPDFRALSPSDRGLARAIATVAIRQLGFIRKTLAARLKQGWPANAAFLEPAMIAGVAQILVLDVPDYAAVDTTIAKIKADRRSDRYASLANAILRGIARDRESLLASCDPLTDNTPEWLAERWTAAYGETLARGIAAAHMDEPPLDISVSTDPAGWAERLGAQMMPGGSLRLRQPGAVTDLPGFADGGWWVQDAAAAFPAALLAVRPGERVLDLCAAPGGKTAQLAAAGGIVTAVDRSAPRLRRLEENMRRLNLAAEVHVSDAATFESPPFPKILLDAPCSATGTIRRHPDVAWNKTLADVAQLVALQSRLLDRAWQLLQPGGRLVYATCSLEMVEGEQQIDSFLSRTPDARLVPVEAGELGNTAEFVTAQGYLRILPAYWADRGGCDGFFAARLEKLGA